MKAILFLIQLCLHHPTTYHRAWELSSVRTPAPSASSMEALLAMTSQKAKLFTTHLVRMWHVTVGRLFLMILMWLLIVLPLQITLSVLSLPPQQPCHASLCLALWPVATEWVQCWSWIHKHILSQLLLLNMLTNPSRTTPSWRFTT